LAKNKSKNNLTESIPNTEKLTRILLKDLLSNIKKQFRHDEYCKSIFSVLPIASRLFRVILSENELKELDIDKMKIVDTKFISEYLHGNVIDMLYTIPLKNGKSGSYIYQAIDFKSRNEYNTAAQMFRYCYVIGVKAWSDAGRPSNFLYPCVLAMIFYCGTGKFTAATDFVDRIDLPKKSNLRKGAVHYGIKLYDLSAKSEDDLPSDAVVNMFFRIQKIIRNKNVNEQALFVFDMFKDRLQADGLLAFVWEMSLYYLYNSAKHFTDEMFNQLVNLTKNLGVKTMLQSLAQKHYKIAKAEGKVEGKAEMIIDILTHRFNKPSVKLQKRIMQVQSTDELNELFKFALSCVSVDEFATAFN
jgi:hypothetical protein